MIKNFFILSLLLILTNCGPTGAALLGPSIAGARTGSVYQAGLSYGSGHVIKKTREGLEKIKETKTIVYQQVDLLHKKIKKNNDKVNKVVLKNQANIFFKAVKNNLKKYN
jgi:hypothetical protein|tara:strand:- start:58 stop:387 length:330 start_codon:yes stop_codon:yes gene_type:complete